LLFPFDGGVTDSPEVTVRGTTPGAVAVSVNGVDATSGDGFLTWRAVVALNRGTNNLVVAAEEADGTIHNRAGAVTVVRKEIAVGASDVALDATNGRLLVVHAVPGAAKSLIGIDLATRATSVVSGEFVGTGPALEELQAIAIDAASNRAFVYDSQARALLAINLANGNRTIISDSTTGTGADFAGISDLGVDASRNRIVAIDGTRLITIELANGNRAHHTDDNDDPRRLSIDPGGDRAIVIDGDAIVSVGLGAPTITTLSDDTTGSGPSFDSPTDLAFDATRNVALVLNPRNTVLEVDLSSGNRTVLSDAAMGTGTAFTGPHDLVVDATRGRALVNDYNDGRDAVLAVDLSSGNRSVLYESARGTGPFFDDPRDVTLDLARDRVLVSDPGSDGDHILAVDLRTGNRTVLAEYPTGTPEGLVVEAARDRILIADTSDFVYAMDPVTGDRTVLSGGATGTGPALETPEDLVVDAANDRALVVDRGLDALLAVDLTTGDRTVVSDGAVGAGPNLDSPSDVELDAANNRVIVIDGGLQAVLEIDLQSGDRKILSDATTGSGPAIRANEGFHLDLARNRAILVESRTILAVDLTTGNRTILSDPDTGAGPPLDFTQEDVVVLPGDVALIMGDSAYNFLFAVDLETGDRFIYSK
ncbi:MAG: hypothetical protein ACYTGZ_19790, partial [Planctomycetota bacterium]